MLPPLFRRLLDAGLYSSLWLAAAAAAQAAATLQHLPVGPGPAPWRVAALVGAATLAVYATDACLPAKQREPAGSSARKAWQQRHPHTLLALAGAAAATATWLILADGWLRFAPLLLPLGGLALAYSWAIWPWRGRRRALREVPLLKVFLIGGVWAAATVGVPALARQQPLGSVAALLAERAALVTALAIVFDIRDLRRDHAAGLRTWPTVLGVAGAKAVSLALLGGSVMLGLARGGAGLPVLGPAALAAVVVLAAQETRGDYFFALLTDGVLLAVGY